MYVTYIYIYYVYVYIYITYRHLYQRPAPRDCAYFVGPSIELAWRVVQAAESRKANENRYRCGFSPILLGWKSMKLTLSILCVFFVRFFEESVTLVKALDTVEASEILLH